MSRPNNLVAHSAAKFKMIPKPSRCGNHCALQSVTISWVRTRIFGRITNSIICCDHCLFFGFHRWPNNLHHRRNRPSLAPAFGNQQKKRLNRRNCKNLGGLSLPSMALTGVVISKSCGNGQSIQCLISGKACGNGMA